MQAAQFVQEVRFRRGMDLPTAARNLPRAAAATNRRVGWTPTVAGADGSAQRPPMLPGEDRSSGFRRQARASDWRDCPEPAGNGGRWPVRLTRQSCDAGGPAQRYGGPPTPANGARAVRARFNFARMVRTAQAAVSNRISVGCPLAGPPR